MIRRHAELVDDIYLAYIRALSVTAEADLADFIAEYAAPCGRAESCEEVQELLVDKARTPRAIAINPERRTKDTELRPLAELARRARNSTSGSGPAY
jgi:hypothetical protein